MQNVVQSGHLTTRPFAAILATAGTAICVLPYDRNRNYLLIQNNSTGNILVGLDSAPTLNQCLVIGPGNFWEPNVTPWNSIYVVSQTLITAFGCAIFASGPGH